MIKHYNYSVFRRFLEPLQNLKHIPTAHTHTRTSTSHAWKREEAANDRFRGYEQHRRGRGSLLLRLSLVKINEFFLGSICFDLDMHMREMEMKEET